MTMKTNELQAELRRVTGDSSIQVNDDTVDAVVVGTLDRTTGSGTTFGRWEDPAAVLAEIRNLPDGDGSTDDWDALGIPEFDDRWIVI